MYVKGRDEPKRQALFGFMLGAVQHQRKQAAGQLSMNGMDMSQGVADFLIGAGQFGKSCVKYCSQNLLGYEVDLGNLRTKLPEILNLPKGTFMEILNPTDNEVYQTAVILVRAFRRGAEPVVHVAMDPTKVAKVLQHCRRRHAVVGGDTLSGNAKVSIEKQEASAFIESMSNVVPACQANLMAPAPQVAGYSVTEICVWPEVHARKHLPPEQLELLKAPTTKESVFKQGDAALLQMSNAGMRIMAFGCDGGVHGMEINSSLHRTDGLKLRIVAERTPLSHSGLRGRFGIKLVVCRTTKGNVIAGVYDANHMLKRQREATSSGAYLILTGPSSYNSRGWWWACGVPKEIVNAPDAMSDTLAHKGVSSTVLARLVENAPIGIDPTGTVVMIMLIGEAYDATQIDSMLDVERIARLELAASFLVLIREYVKQDPTLSTTTNAMHKVPFDNFQLMVNGVEALLLDWAETLPDEPKNPKA